MSDGGESIRVVQIGLNSCDIVASARLFAELGFHNAGGQMIWGDTMAIQGLEPSARALMWWLVGRQEFMQLELFQHTSPMQRPLPADWRCSDLGWNRFGIAVSDLDAAKAVLAAREIAITGESAASEPVKRLAFREPFIGCYIELFEDGDGLPGGRAPRHHDLDPAVVYATSSVSDLAAARNYYENDLQLKIADHIEIHRPEHEAFWGLDGATSESFVVDPGGFLLEIVQYLDPAPRPKHADFNITDQGIMNIALASRDPAVAKQAIDRVRKTGCRMGPFIEMAGSCVDYVLEPEREVEICGIPEALDASVGFAPTSPFWGVQS